MHGLLSLISDVVLMGLLVAVIWFAVRLNRKLDVLRDSRADLENLVQRLLETTARAESGLRELKTMASVTGASLKEQTDKAEKLRDEVHFMADSANQAAERLLDAVAKSRAAGKAPARTETMPDPRVESPRIEAEGSIDAFQGIKKTADIGKLAASAKSKAEKDLMQAMEAAHLAPPAKPASQ